MLPNPQELDLQAKKAFALSILNSFRHCLQERPGAELTDLEKNLLLDSLTFYQEKNATKSIVYGMVSYPDSFKASAVQVWEAIQNALKSVCKNQAEARSIIEILNQSLNDLNIVQKEDKEKLLDLITIAMHHAIPEFQVAL